MQKLYTPWHGHLSADQSLQLQTMAVQCLWGSLVMQIAVVCLRSLAYHGKAGNAFPKLCTHVVVQMRVCVKGRLALPLSKAFSKKALSSPWIIQARFLPIPCWSSCPLFPISIINGLLISLKQAPCPSREAPIPSQHLKMTCFTAHSIQMTREVINHVRYVMWFAKLSCDT